MRKQRQNGGRRRKTIGTKANSPALPANVIARPDPAGMPAKAIPAHGWMEITADGITDIGDIRNLTTHGTSCAVAVSVNLGKT
jgi:hypothetical protein